MIHTSDCKKWLGADSIDTSHRLNHQGRTSSIQRLGVNPNFIRNNLYDMCRPTCQNPHYSTGQANSISIDHPSAPPALRIPRPSIPSHQAKDHLHTDLFPMRYVTVLACEHSYPLHLDLASRPQATGHNQISTQVPSATGHSGYQHKTFQPRPESKQLDTPAISTRVPKQLDIPAIHTRDPLSLSKEAKSHPSPTNRTEESGRPGLCPVNPN